MDWTEANGTGTEAACHGTYAGLKSWAEDKGFKPGWASQKFKTIFGRWPNGEQVEEAAAPNANLVWWIKREGTRWAREKRKAEAATLKPVEPEKKSALMSEEDWEVAL